MAALRSLTPERDPIRRDTRALAALLYVLSAPFLAGTLYNLHSRAWFAAACWSVLATFLLGSAYLVNRRTSSPST